MEVVDNDDNESNGVIYGVIYGYDRIVTRRSWDIDSAARNSILLG